MSVSSLTTAVPPERGKGSADVQPLGLSRADVERAAKLMNAIEAVYRDRFSTFHRVATAITGNPDLGRDAVQEAFARAIRWRRDFHGDGPLEGWLWRTVINVAKDHCRTTKATKWPAELVDLPDASGRGPDDHSEELIRQRVAALPDRQRVALFLRYYVDMSYAEIGDALEIRTGTVSATLNAAHRALRTSLEGVLDDGPQVGSTIPNAAGVATTRRRRRPELPVSVCVGARTTRRRQAI